VRVGESAAGGVDTARQMIESAYGTGADVMLGGGRSYFLPKTRRDPEYPQLHGRRADERDLVALWRQRHPGGRYVWNAGQLESAETDTPLLALFEPDHMHFEHDRARDAAGEPSLAQMTRAALLRLQSISRARGADGGYVLLVEGGRIDHAHHYGNAYRALVDAVAFSDAVRVADTMTSSSDTLILVTADHSHTLTFAGYPVRGNPILGKVRGASGEEEATGPYALDALGLPYTTLSYANGPGYPGATSQQPEGPKRYRHLHQGAFAVRDGRPDLSRLDTQSPDYLQESTLPLEDETHGGDDVGLWARGPGSEAVRGSLEQHAVFHLMLQANPVLRRRLCEGGACDARGIPVALPSPATFRTGS
jgi:alkaline phosphatase